MKAVAFDAYGTLFDVFSITALGEELFPGKGDALAQLWRLKQLQYSMLRSLMGRHRDFWRLTEDALVYATRSLGLDLTPDKRARLLEAYLTLTAFPDVKPGLEALKRRGLRLAILSNGEPKMLEAAARSAGIHAPVSAMARHRLSVMTIVAGSAGAMPNSNALIAASAARTAITSRSMRIPEVRGKYVAPKL